MPAGELSASSYVGLATLRSIRHGAGDGGEDMTKNNRSKLLFIPGALALVVALGGGAVAAASGGRESDDPKSLLLEATAKQCRHPLLVLDYEHPHESSCAPEAFGHGGSQLSTASSLDIGLARSQRAGW